jgi:hypothetical protein
MILAVLINIGTMGGLSVLYGFALFEMMPKFVCPAGEGLEWVTCNNQ